MGNEDRRRLTRILRDGRQGLFRKSSSSSDRVKVVIECGEVSILSFGEIEQGRLNVQLGEMLGLSDEAIDAVVSVHRWQQMEATHPSTSLPQSDSLSSSLLSDSMKESIFFSADESSE